jgi:DNA-binding transcriptional LysR family regulator
MDLRVLRYFVATAEAGSISRAADALHISQPALTARIKELEDELGVALLVRLPRGIELTAAGRQLQLDAQRLLNDAESLKERARRPQGHLTGTLSIAINVLHTWVPSVVGILGAFRRQHPLVDLKLTPMMSGRQIETLRRGEIDGGFLYCRPGDDRSLRGVPVHRSQVLLAMHRDSDLARRPPRCLAELNGKDFIWFPRSASFNYYDSMNECFRGAGFVPKIVQEGADNAAMLGLVAAGIGCSLVPATEGWRGLDEVVLHPLADECLKLTLEFTWVADRESSAVSSLIAICEERTAGATRST